LNLKRLEQLSLKEFNILNSLVKKQHVHAVLSSGKLQGISSFRAVLDLISKTESIYRLGDLKKSLYVDSVSLIQKRRSAI
jgi:hypothetical protein